MQFILWLFILLIVGWPIGFFCGGLWVYPAQKGSSCDAGMFVKIDLTIL